MRRGLLLVLGLVSGCSSDDTQYPLSPGGGGGGLGGIGEGEPPPRDGGTDATTLDGGGETVLGRVCVLQDLRSFGQPCMPSGAGVSVRLGTGTAVTTDASGLFMVPRPSGTGTDLQLVATASNFVTSVVPYDPANVVVPILATTTYETLLSANLATVQANQGSVVVRFGTDAMGAAGATASVFNGTGPTLYDDGNGDAVWARDGTTQASGLAWLPGVSVGSPTLVIIKPNGSPVQRTVRVLDRAITFVRIAP